MSSKNRDVSEADASAAHTWLQRFASAIEQGSAEDVARLFGPDAAWRDILTFTGDFRTVHGAEAIRRLLDQARGQGTTTGFKVSEPTRLDWGTRTGPQALEVVFNLESSRGVGRGVVRLVPDPSSSDSTASATGLVAWTLMTSLEAARREHLHKIEARPPEADYESTDRRSWADYRQLERDFADREPEVLIVGAGQSGLGLAARLREAGVDCLVIDRFSRVGDNWRNRYKMLRLHNEIGQNHMPYMPFPSTWPRYIPKDKLAGWLEAYAESMELNVWTETELIGAEHSPERGEWEVRVRRADEVRVLRPRHLVLAIGVSGTARRPDIAGLGTFTGEVLHSADYSDGRGFHSRRVLVVGSGVSAHDICQDLYHHGAHVTMMQRSKTIITSLRPGAEMVYAHYRSQEPLDYLDLISVSVPYPVKRDRAEAITNTIRALDAELIEGLEARGFRTHWGHDGTGFQMQFHRAGGGYYIDVGCSGLIVDGKVRVLPAAELARIVPTGIERVDGTYEAYDAIVLATGYHPFQDTVRALLGEDVAERVGPVWGLDDEGETRNVCRPTEQEGLWFIAGGLVEARVFSKYLAVSLVSELSGKPLLNKLPVAGRS